jgi:AGCS family alanine or glycine:cation symporter
MDALPRWLDQAAALVWGGPTVVLLLATGAYLSFILRGVQLRRLGSALRTALRVRDEPDAEGDISHFQALMLALGGDVGVGNVVGVAAALAAGGPGALFWLWVAGWLAMATRYAEGLLGVYYREADRRGRMAGGPMYYLSRGVGGWFGRLLALVFALGAVLAALGIGSAVPGHVAAGALEASLSIPPLLTALLLAAAATVVFGGIRKLGRVAGALVPVLVGIYLLAGVAAIVLHIDRLGAVLVEIGQGAITVGAVSGGLLGGVTREAVRWGMSQGVLSSGTGLGSGAIAAASARTRRPTTQALVAMTQTFIDTVVVSAVTGLAVLVTGLHDGIAAAVGAAYTGTPMTTAAFRSGLPPGFGGVIVSVGLALFAFTSLLAWAYYGERSAEYLFGSRVTVPFRVLFVAAVFSGGLALQLGATDTIGLLWGVSELAGGAMLIPNLLGLFLLSGVLVRETARSPGTR